MSSSVHESENEDRSLRRSKSAITSQAFVAPELRHYKLSLLSLFIIVFSSVIIDQGSKYIAEQNLRVWEHPQDIKQYQGRRVPMLDFGDHIQAYGQLETEPSFYLAFAFNYVRNTGAAWGFLSDWEDRYRIPFFYAVTLFVVILILGYLRSTPAHHRLPRLALTLILSGAIGNFTDRVIRGYVVDFLDVRWVLPLPLGSFNIDFFPDFLAILNGSYNIRAWAYNFPNFNWADSMITCGVAFLIVDMIFFEAVRKKREEPMI